MRLTRDRSEDIHRGAGVCGVGWAKGCQAAPVARVGGRWRALAVGLRRRWRWGCAGVGGRCAVLLREGLHPEWGFAPAAGAGGPPGWAGVHPEWGFAPGAGAVGREFGVLAPAPGANPHRGCRVRREFGVLAPISGADPHSGCSVGPASRAPAGRWPPFRVQRWPAAALAAAAPVRVQTPVPGAALARQRALQTTRLAGCLPPPRVQAPPGSRCSPHGPRRRGTAATARSRRRADHRRRFQRSPWLRGAGSTTTHRW